MRNGYRRTAGISLVGFVLVAMCLVVLPVSAGSADVGPVEPLLIAGNATCGDLDQGWVEFHKVDPVGESGVWPAADADMWVAWNSYEVDEGKAFDWSSNFAVAGVFVKGGPNGYLYRYSPGAFADSGLHAPEVSSGTWAGLSHISFCYLETPPTTPTSPPDTPPSSPPETTPTTPPATTPNPLLGEIGDYVWEDADGDGFQEAGEPGVAGIEVKLLKDPATISTTVTDSAGLYLFTGLAAGVYRVEFTLPVGFEFTTANVAGDDALDSDADRNTGRTGDITLSEGEKDHTWDAGILRPTEVLPLVVVATSAPEVLPFTGTPDTQSLVGLAAAMFALGGMAVLALRRKEVQPVGGWSRRLPEVH